MAVLNPWINFNGNAEEAFNFYKSVSGIEENKIMYVKGLLVGGEIEGEMEDSPWGSYAGMFRDKYGIEWIIESSSYGK